MTRKGERRARPHVCQTCGRAYTGWHCPRCCKRKCGGRGGASGGRRGSRYRMQSILSRDVIVAHPIEDADQLVSEDGPLPTSPVAEKMATGEEAGESAANDA